MDNRLNETGDVMNDSNDLTKSIPPAAPKWSVGLVTIIAALVGGFMLLWGYVQPMIQKSLDSGMQLRDKQYAGESRVLDSLMDTVKNNQLQITNLSAAVSEAQRANNNTAERVTSLERDLNTAKQSVLECETRLKSCKKW